MTMSWYRKDTKAGKFNQFRQYHMMIIMEFYTTSHGKFMTEDSLIRYKQHWYMGCYTSKALSNHNHMEIIMYHVLLYIGRNLMK